MGELKTPLPVQLVAGLIVHPSERFDRVRAALTGLWGPVGLESPVWPFDFTDYYAAEMGTGLLRQFLAFERLFPVDGLHRAKLASNEIETRLSVGSPAGVRRAVNIDPGYLCHSKLVLFTTKDFSHRIYVADGIFAEITLVWSGSEFAVHPWTFPDYRTVEYRNFFAAVRSDYVRKLKSAT